MPKPCVLVLGATGFVGTNLTQALSNHDLNIVRTSKSDGVDLRDASQAEALLKQVQPNYIVNCAAHVGSLNYVTQQAADIVRNNTLMILGLYEAAAKAAPEAVIINPIANCAYPNVGATFREEEWWNGHLHRSVLSFGATRRHLWAVAECYAMQRGVHSLHLLVPNMFGPNDSSDPNKAHALNALVAKFVRAERSGEEVRVWGTGVAVREWLYAPDFGRVIGEVISRGSQRIGFSEPVNVAQNYGLSVRDLVSLIEAQFARPARVVWELEKPDGAPRKVMDDTRFRRVFPDFRFTPIEEGIHSTIDFYRSIA